jgi:hypothetical protein
VKEEFSRHGQLLVLMLRYTQALITQIAQTAVCNRHHSIDQQLCRWLLLSMDRLSDGRLTMTQEFISTMLGVRREGVTQSALNCECYEGNPQQQLHSDGDIADFGHGESICPGTARPGELTRATNSGVLPPPRALTHRHRRTQGRAYEDMQEPAAKRSQTPNARRQRAAPLNDLRLIGPRGPSNRGMDPGKRPC